MDVSPPKPAVSLVLHQRTPAQDLRKQELRGAFLATKRSQAQRRKYSTNSSTEPDSDSDSVGSHSVPLSENRIRPRTCRSESWRGRRPRSVLRYCGRPRPTSLGSTHRSRKPPPRVGMRGVLKFELRGNRSSIAAGDAPPPMRFGKAPDVLFLQATNAQRRPKAPRSQRTLARRRADIRRRRCDGGAPRAAGSEEIRSRARG